MSDIKPLIDLSNQIREKQVRYSELNWTYYTTGLDFEIESARKEMMTIYKDKNNFDLIRKFKEKRGALSPDDQRRVEILFNSFEGYHLSEELNKLDDEIFEVENKLSGILNNHRCTIDGKEVSSTEISSLISKNDDPQIRRKAWESKSQVNQPLFDGDFLELNKLRREYAKLYGSKNFVEYALKVDELSPSVFEGWEERTKGALPSINKKKNEFAQKYLGQDELKPWDISYLSGKICPSRNADVDMMNFKDPIRDMFGRFGFDIDSKNVTFDVFPRKNKSEWGYNFTIDYGKDTRILANVNNEFHHFWVLMHEAGHAVHYGSVDPDDYIMNMGISGIISEGLANLFGDLIYHPSFFVGMFSDTKKAEAEFNALMSWNKMTTLLDVDRILFDQALFTEKLETHDDIKNLRLKYMKELGGIDDFTGEPPWAFLIHHTTHPIYLHNYFMGDVTCAMLKKVFCQQTGLADIHQKPLEFGNFLMEKVISPSGRYRYEELFESIAGSKFSLDYLLED
jgi:oligoendopeptidase F